MVLAWLCFVLAFPWLAFQEQSATIFGLTTLLASRLIYNVSWLHDVAFQCFSLISPMFYLFSLHTTFDQVLAHLDCQFAGRKTWSFYYKWLFLAFAHWHMVS